MENNITKIPINFIINSLTPFQITKIERDYEIFTKLKNRPKNIKFDIYKMKLSEEYGVCLKTIDIIYYNHCKNEL